MLRPCLRSLCRGRSRLSPARAPAKPESRPSAINPRFCPSPPLRSRLAQIVMAILGLYAGIATYYQIKGGFTKSSEVRGMPAPSKPDFTTRECRWAGRE